MRLSTIFELLLILLLVAFAAYGRVIDRNEALHRVARATNNVKQSDIDLTTMSLKQATDSVNRYCTCNENICNCCRDFHIPLVQLKGPGCASLQYLQGDNLAVQLSFGDNILTSTIVNGKNPKPVCVPLPGGFTHFCGRIYSIQRDAKNHFKACLGLELQSPTELEATLRVSCFRFGPDGLKLRPAEPLPTVETEASEEDDDDDDFFGLGADDDDDDEDESPSQNSVPDASTVDEVQESDDEDDEDDLLGFSALLDIFTGDDEEPTRDRITTAPPLLEFTIPILPRPTTPSSLEDHELPLSPDEQDSNYEENDTQEPFKAEEGGGEEEEEEEEEEQEEEEHTGLFESNTEDNTDENQEQITEPSNKIVYTTKPNKTSTVIKVKKGVVGDKKKPTVTSASVNAIHDPVKPGKKPIKDEDDEDDDDDDDILDDDDEDIDDDEDDEILDDDDDDKDDDEDEDEEDEDKLDDEKHADHDDDEEEKAEDLADLIDDDDDDEEEDTMLSALMGTGKSKKSKEGTKTNQTNVHEHDDEDYELEFLARKRHSNENRQSKITRL
ncbi:protein PFC0760c [Solenopsis invicta]|uniref:protein PFC0760c n=1 Tax=Solenopsis invicta TaxID=13686 RepID=UPI0005958855|nr:protein PFC0760c [Solenopsis invicta]XP_039305263.1 protein PFC0760c [Solenopsis invicta]